MEEPHTGGLGPLGQSNKNRLKTEYSHRSLIALTHGLRVQNKRFFGEQRAWL